MRQDDLVDVASVSDELYGLPLNEFTPTRTAREQQARAAGDKALASQIHQLAKPNLVAWLANQLARECADEIWPLLELGVQMREATATSSGDRLRELSRQQRQLVFALVRQARRLATAAGRKVSADTERGLEDTLRAALADPAAADALAAGRLTAGLQNSGLGGPHVRDERPARPARAPATAAPPSPAPRDRATGHRQRAEHDVDRAKSAADEAKTVRAETHDLLEAADRTVTDGRAQVERVRRELDEALLRQSGTEKDQRRARIAFDRADKKSRDAQRHLADVTERLDRLAP
jgi:hypothetical protein